MTLMVQDLTNPMLAQIPHCSWPHSGYDHGRGNQRHAILSGGFINLRRRCIRDCIAAASGMVDLATIQGAGFGYRLDEIERSLPEPAVVVGGSI